MKITTLFAILMLHTMDMMAQNPFVGTFIGAINGDKVTLTLQTATNNAFVGKMKDSQQTYDVNANATGNKIVGTATEKTLGLTFNFTGTLNGTQLSTLMSIEVLGQKQNFQVEFSKQVVNVAQETKKPQTTPQYNRPQMPASGKIDPNLVGKWVNEQQYNSGSGDGFFAGSTTQSLIFFADGSLSDGGSSTTVSGSNYYGNAGDKGQAAPLPNVSWYVQNQHIFIIASADGQVQTVDLGKYYIENGAMLITGNNGKKLLLQKR